MNIFNSVKKTRVKKSLFDLTHDVKLSCQMGQLIPILNMPCLPGDRVQIAGETLVRFAPMLAPMMHRVDVSIHYFFVPWRILWANWEKYITGQPLNPSDPVSVPAVPTLDYAALTPDRPSMVLLGDYLGLPPIPAGSVGTFPITAFAWAAYHRIWFEYYRDQNLQFPQADPWMLVDGNNIPNDEFLECAMLNRCWERDYFTSALPWAQKGPDVRIPMALTANEASLITEADGTIVAGALSTGVDGGLESGGSPLQVNAGTINDLRKARSLQMWLENNARGGTRYKESLLAHFDVVASDKRLQRPEYITGLKTPVVISQVLNNTGTDTLPQGNMAGHGVAVTGGKHGRYFCEEHGTLMGILSIMPKTAYQQGVDKQFLKFDYLDHGWPEFAHIGEQPIDYNELYAYQMAAGTADSTFGYTPRFAEYKFMQNRVCGDFRTTLNYWHMGRIFDAVPSLNDTFVVSDPTDRIFAVTDPGTQHMYCQVLNHIKAVRPLPKYGTPKW